MEKNPSHSTGQLVTGSLTAEQRERRRTTKTVPESDKDSGYSDVASECLSSVEQTDGEDEPLAGHWNAKLSSSCGSASRPAPIVLKNVLLDQETSPGSNVPSWTVQPSFQLLQSSPQFLLFPAAVTTGTTETSCQKRSRYLPILNSYTKIAPYPCHLKPGFSSPLRCKKRPDPSHQSQSKRTHCAMQVQNLKEASVALRADARDGEGPLQGVVVISSEQIGNKSQNNPVPAESLGVAGDPPSKSSSRHVPAVVSQVALAAFGNKNLKTQRFQNTWEILHDSGLLGIAMQTKELVRLNQVTQNQLEKLKEQVQLYAKAMGSRDPCDWQKLEETMTSNGQDQAL